MFQAFQHDLEARKVDRNKLLKTYSFSSCLKKLGFTEGSRGNISLDKLFEHVSIKKSITGRQFLLSVTLNRTNISIAF